MPAGEPNIDAPAYVWAGEYDAQAIADATGASWAAPLFALAQKRVVDIAALCAAPAPSAPVFTTTDLVLGLNPFADNTAIRQKLADYVDAGLWRAYCTPVDDPAPDPIPDNPPPADLPTYPPPEGTTDKQRREMWTWLEWMRRMIVPRKYWIGPGYFVSGTGTIDFDSDDSGAWTVWPAGVIVDVMAKPDWAGRTGGGDPPILFDLGRFSVGGPAHFDEPMRLMRDHQMLYGRTGELRSFAYNLSPDVDIYVAPLYPETATVVE